MGHLIPPALDDPAAAPTFSHYGFSYLQDLDTSYFLMGRFMAVVASFCPPEIAARLFNVLLFIVVASYALIRLRGSLAAGVLWVTLLFAAILGQNRLFVAEEEQGGFDGFLLAPVDRTALFVAKAVTLFTFLCAVELVALPAYALLLLGPGLDGALPELLAIVALANVGLAAVGALVAAIASESAVRELIVPLLLLPLLVPLLIACAQASEPLLREGGGPDELGRWLGLLTLYDVVFVLLSVAVFDFLLED